MPEISFPGAVLAGLLSFFSPCVLPMVPFYLSYMTGLSVGELRDDGIAPGARGRLVRAAVLFALGVTTVFVLLGMGATAAGQAVSAHLDGLSWAAAAVLTVFGLHFLGLVRLPFLNREFRARGPARVSGAFGAYLMGLAFGFGWTPCVGPALAAILLLAGGMGEVGHGAALLLAYGLAMTAPFVLAAGFAGPFLRWVQTRRRHLAHVEKAMGVLLIVFALFIATGTVGQIAVWLLRVVPGFQGLG